MDKYQTVLPKLLLSHLTDEFKMNNQIPQKELQKQIEALKVI